MRYEKPIVMELGKRAKAQGQEPQACVDGNGVGTPWYCSEGGVAGQSGSCTDGSVASFDCYGGGEASPGSVCTSGPIPYK